MLHAREDYQERIQDSASLIPEDEPVFLIRAQDVTAPSVVLYWAECAEDEGASSNMVRVARQHAARMLEWQREHGVKVPDMP